jgi:hypothetical protein
MSPCINWFMWILHVHRLVFTFQVKMYSVFTTQIFYFKSNIHYYEQTFSLINCWYAQGYVTTRMPRWTFYSWLNKIQGCIKDTIKRIVHKLTSYECHSWPLVITWKIYLCKIRRFTTHVTYPFSTKLALKTHSPYI